MIRILLARIVLEVTAVLFFLFAIVGLTYSVSWLLAPLNLGTAAETIATVSLACVVTLANGWALRVARRRRVALGERP